MNVGQRLSRNSVVLSPVVQKRAYPGGAALKILKRRGATVKQIGKITGTMKVVASSKLPGAQAKAHSVAPFYNSLAPLFSPLVASLKEEDLSEKNILTVAIFTDKGLCGSTNNQISRMLEKQSLSNHKLVLWGEKGTPVFEKSKHASKVAFSVHPGVKTPLTFAEVSGVVEQILSQEFDLIRIIYNQMTGPASSEIKELWLPSVAALTSDEARTVLASYEIEATASEELLTGLSELHLGAALNFVHFQNLAVEFFARRNSMENASKNAGDVGKKLTLLFNKARQAAITTELGEIVSGAAAVDEMLKQ